MIAHQPPQGFTLVTGATGFLGHVILADLLARGHRCVVLSRVQAASTQETIAALLSDQNLCATELQARGRLAFMPGALPEALPRTRLAIARIVHCAASTRFTTDDRGEPARTNEHGTRSLLEFATLQGVREFHLISTAYSSGVVNGPVPEQVLQAPLRFRNSYERSKWAAEVQVQEWARSPGHTATILRPSIIVGDSRTGRASKFNGLYLAFRAYDRCVRSWRQEGRGTGVFDLRVEGGPTDRMNFVPVDHTAALIAHVVSNPEHHGGVYNLVDPAPMTNQELLDAMQHHYGLSGASFVPITTRIDHPPSPEDRSFASAISGQRAYLAAPPTFARAATQQLERSLGRKWPAWDRTGIGRLIEYAKACDWGRSVAEPRMPATPRDDAAAFIAAYFHEFLPEAIGRSGLAGMTELDTKFRFMVEDVDRGSWICTFRRGALTQVLRSSCEDGVDFTYRMGAAAFMDIVGAKVDPQGVFLEERAQISGNFESALKMGMILQQFTQECPYQPDLMQQRVQGAVA